MAPTALRSSIRTELRTLLLATLLALGLVPGAPGGATNAAALQATIIYVDLEATGANDGTSWADAFTGLQPALDIAAPGDEIRVAAGTYYPTAERGGSGDRYRSFQLLNGVGIFGGFDPSRGDVEWQDRDWVMNLTVLSCNIGAPGAGDNCYHVFYHPAEAALDSNAVLDGFAVTGGNANDRGVHASGGGMYNDLSSPTLRNCRFAGNSATEQGGGMYNSRSAPALFNCEFSGNSSLGDGGALSNWWSAPVLSDCTILDNDAADDGGGSANWWSSLAVGNSTIAGNSAADNGGGIYNYGFGSASSSTNSVFHGNSAANAGGAIWNAFGAPSLTNSILWASTPGEISGEGVLVTYSDVQGGYGGQGNIDILPLWVDPGNHDYHLGSGSPCIDAGDNDALFLPPYDSDGEYRTADGTGDGVAIVDMGVDEVLLSPPDVSGWIHVHDAPLVGAMVALRQPGEPNLTEVTDADGRFAFASIVANKRFSVALRRQPPFGPGTGDAPAGDEAGQGRLPVASARQTLTVSGGIDLYGLPLVQRPVILRQQGEPNLETETDHTGYYTFAGVNDEKPLNVLIDGAQVPPCPESRALTEAIANAHSILWVGPHPDDELFVGGLLGHLSRDREYDATIVAFFSNRRLVESNEQSARFLDADYIRIPDRLGNDPPDCESDDIECLVQAWQTDGTQDELIAILQAKAPDIVITFEPMTRHHSEPIHVAVAIVAELALCESGIETSLFYVLETTSLMEEEADPDRWGVTDVFSLNESLWSYRLTIFEIYSPYWYDIERIVEDIEFQDSLLRQELYRRPLGDCCAGY